MPYRKRYRKKKQSGFKRRARIYGRAGGQLYKDVMYIKSLVNSELHYVDNSYTGQNISSAGSIYHLSGISQGDTNSTRSGNSVLPRYLNLIIKLQNGNADDVVRCMIFRWKDNSVPAMADIFENSSTPVYSPLNDNISGNVKDRKIDVLVTERIVLIPNTSAEIVLWKENIDLNAPTKTVKDHIKYDDNTSTAPLGGIYMLLVGRQPTTTTAMEGNAKFSFHDN